ncbi:unnamed protein product [Dicrocoelium dendriticum]|nr:unnamed protein product [Dicrocoelium dendriticum]
MHRLLWFVFSLCELFCACSLHLQRSEHNVFRHQTVLSNKKLKLVSLKGRSELAMKTFGMTESLVSNIDQQVEDENQDSPLLHLVSNVDRYGKWSKWSECVRRSCIQYRYRRCADNSWKHVYLSDFGKHKCPSAFIMETRECTKREACLVSETFHNCGIRPLYMNVDFKVMGGESSFSNSWPWMVRLTIKSTSDNTMKMCGGTLITSQWILTAAHCFSNLAKNITFDEKDSHDVDGFVLAHLADHRVSVLEQSQRDHLVEEIVLHYDYHEGQANNGADIALLYMEKPVEGHPKVKVACMPVDFTVPDLGTDCYTVGWGQSEAGFIDQMTGAMTQPQTSDVLRQVGVTVWNTTECSKYYGNLDEKRTLCAGSKGKGACFGDSGGGLYCRSPYSRAWFVAGVTSFGARDSCGHIPDVYTSVTAHRDWIWGIITGSTSELDMYSEQLGFEGKLMERIKGKAEGGELDDLIAEIDRKLMEKIENAVAGDESVDTIADKDQSVTTEMETEESMITEVKRNLTERIKRAPERGGLPDTTAGETGIM